MDSRSHATPSVRLDLQLIKPGGFGRLAEEKDRRSLKNPIVQPLSLARLYPIIGTNPLDEQEAAIRRGPVGDQVLSFRRNLVGASNPKDPRFLLRLARGYGQSTFKNEIVIGALFVKVPGNGFSRRERENPYLDVATDYH
jgi:hypothetical protein